MANDITRKVWVLDTASTTPVWKGNIRAEALMWSGVFAAGDQLILQDSKGGEVWTAVAPQAGFFNFQKLMWGADGLTVVRIDSGKVYISIN